MITEIKGGYIVAFDGEEHRNMKDGVVIIEEDKVKPLLDIPEEWYTCAHVPIGYPVGGGHDPISRRPMEAMVHFNSWDSPEVG